MKKRQAIPLFGLLLVAVVGVAAALLLSNQREVTTSSDAAYRLWREALENERRFYMKEARMGYAKALELDPDFAAAMLGLARQSDKEKALSLLHRAERLKSRLTERERLHIDLHIAAAEKGPAEQLKVAREILRRYPDDFRATTVLAMDEARKGRMEEAVRVFTRLLEADPNSADAYNMIGYHYGYRGDYEKAIENLKKYQFMAPDQANPHDSLGEIQAYSGHYDEAIQNLNRALSIKPDFFPAYDHLGVAYEGKGEYAKAFDSYVKASELMPVEGEKGMYLARALRVACIMGDRERAASLRPRFEKIPKDEHTDVVRPLIDAAYDLVEGRSAEAERRLAELKPRADEHLKKMSKNRPDYKPYLADWNWLMARAKVELGKDAEAIALYEEMRNPPNGWQRFEGRQMVYEARAQLAALLAKRGELDRAEKLLEENKRWNPSWAPTRPAETAVAELRRARVLASAK
ncbi:MAG TPA: tetratricopeptide repeat protein [Thermoanaerobaculia bacterium]|jgi:tetratricopeptide (TPR) repeat protein|nr:tetratricopeptide repeat protein [Thermoanaerobaculia bacterium]